MVGLRRRKTNVGTNTRTKKRSHRLYGKKTVCRSIRIDGYVDESKTCQER